MGSGTTLLVGAELFLCAGEFPLGRVPTIPRTRLEGELAPAGLPYAWPPPNRAGSWNTRDLDQVLLAAGGWRVEVISNPLGALILPPRDLRLDPLAPPVPESAVTTLRDALAHLGARGSAPPRSRAAVVLLPAVPRTPVPHLLYLGARRGTSTPRSGASRPPGAPIPSISVAA